MVFGIDLSDLLGTYSVCWSPSTYVIIPKVETVSIYTTNMKHVFIVRQMGQFIVLLFLCFTGSIQVYSCLPCV